MVIAMKAMRLKNVKAFADTGDIELAPITIFVGQNSCGKSSFLRFPVVLSQSAHDNAFPISLHSDQSKLIDYGSFRDVLHNHAGKDFSCELTFEYKKLNVPRIEFQAWVWSKFTEVDAETIMPDGSELRSEPQAYEEASYSDEDDLVDYYYNAKHTGYDPQVENTELEPRLITVAITYSLDAQKGNMFIKTFTVSLDGIPFYRVIKKPDGYNLRIEKIKGAYGFQNYNYDMPVAAENNSLCLTLDSVSVISDFIRDAFNLDEQQYLEAAKKIDIMKRYGVGNPYQYFERKYHQLEHKHLKKYGVIQFVLRMNDALNSYMCKEMKALHYIGPFRSNPERIYRRNDTIKDNVGTKGEHAVKLLIKESNAITKEVSKWFEKAFNYQLLVEPLEGKTHNGEEAEYYQIKLRNLESMAESNIMDVGYGISQVFPIVTQIAMTSVTSVLDGNSTEPIDETYIIEQPELHLHPAAQSKLADLFASAISENAFQHRTFLIETHSEHFIRALQIMIADPDCFLDETMVKFYYVDKTEEGASEITEMEITEDGLFKEEWKPGFFDASYNLFEQLMIQISKKRMQKDAEI